MKSENVQYTKILLIISCFSFCFSYIFTPLQGDVVCEAASGGIALLFDWEMPKDAGAAETLFVIWQWHVYNNRRWVNNGKHVNILTWTFRRWNSDLSALGRRLWAPRCRHGGNFRNSDVEGEVQCVLIALCLHCVYRGVVTCMYVWMDVCMNGCMMYVWMDVWYVWMYGMYGMYGTSMYVMYM